MSTSVSSSPSLSLVGTQDAQHQSDVERVTSAVTALIGAQAAAKVIGRPGGVLILDSDELRKLNWTRIDGARTQRRKPGGRDRMILPQASELGMWGIGEGGARQSFRSPVEHFAQELLSKVEIGAMGFEEANEVFRTFEGDATRSALLTARYAQGFYIPRDETTVLVADRIDPGKESAVYLHEVVHSQGMKILGPDVFDRLAGQIRAWNSAPRTTLEWRVQAVASRRALANAGADSDHYDEELFAYAVEEAVAAGVRPTLEGREGSAEQWLGDVVATLRGAVFQITQGAAPELDAQQIVDLAYALAQMESPDRAREIMEALTEGDGAQHATVAGNMESHRFPNGPLSKTPQFAQWFGASKVVSHDGEPLVVYHGTGDDFSEFDPTKIGSRHVDVEVGAAFYFSSDMATANWYANDSGSQRGYGANVMPVYLALQNPRIVDFDGAGLEFLADEIATAKESGNDGLIAIDYDDGGRATHYVAFKPEQIKSALGNSGVFEPNSQDIRYSLDPGQSVSSNGDLRFMSELQQCGDRFEAGFQPDHAPPPR